MQKCMNKDAKNLRQCFIEYPILWALFIAFLLSSFLIMTFGVLCLTSIKCGSINTYALISVGVSLMIIIIVFIIIPWLLRHLLNCIWNKRIKRRKYPHSLTGAGKN